jgi:hypothetical protein
LTAVSKVLRAFAVGGGRTLTDEELDGLLNDSYPGTLKKDLEEAITTKARDLKSAFLDGWKPFGLDDPDVCKDLETQWENLFDGEEVLPDRFLPLAQATGSRLARGRYLVPLSAHKLAQARKDMDFDKELGCFVIRRPYNEDGLDL